MNENKTKIIEYFDVNNIDGDLLLHKKQKDFVNNIVEHCDNNKQLIKPLKLLHQAIMKDETNKLFVDDNGCELLGGKTIVLPKEWVDKNDGKKDIPVGFFFGDTTLKVYFGIEGIPDKKAQIELDYKYYHK